MAGQKVHSVNTLRDHLKTDAERRLFAQDAAILAATGALDDAMENQGVSRAQLAQRLGKTPGFVSQVMSGNRNMTLRTLADFAYALDLQVRGIELSGIGEMRVPADAMNRWLDEYSASRVSHADTQGLASHDRVIVVQTENCSEVSFAA